MERKKFNRITRPRNLTPQEAAADEAVRKKVMTEFPPADRTLPEAGDIAEALKTALQASPQSIYKICQEAGISQIVVSRFLSGERDIRLATADRLAKVLGLSVAKS